MCPLSASIKLFDVKTVPVTLLCSFVIVMGASSTILIALGTYDFCCIIRTNFSSLWTSSTLVDSASSIVRTAL
jgi:hypothetical protein